MTGEQAREPFAPGQDEPAPAAPIARQAPALEGTPTGDTPAIALSPPLSAPRRLRPFPAPPALELARFAWLVESVAFLSLIAVIVFAVTGATFALIGIRPFDGVSPDAYLPGALVEFGRFENAEPYLRRGWGARDSEGRWAIRDVSAIELPYALDASDPLQLSVRFNIQVDPRAGNSVFQILANGTTVFKGVYRQSGAHTARAVIAAPNAMPRQRILLTFLQDRPLAPVPGQGEASLRVDSLVLERASAREKPNEPATIRGALRP